MGIVYYIQPWFLLGEEWNTLAIMNCVVTIKFAGPLIGFSMQGS